MLWMLATLSCVFGGCEAPAEIAEGVWVIRVDLGETSCQGRLDLAPTLAGGLAGTLYLCDGHVGKVRGELHSNELVLDFVPQNFSGSSMTVRASLAGDYLSGAFDNGVVEGWRGEIPTAAPEHPNSSNDEGDDTETA
jgi:hypothetical protein